MKGLWVTVVTFRSTPLKVDISTMAMGSTKARNIRRAILLESRVKSNRLWCKLCRRTSWSGVHWVSTVVNTTRTNWTWCHSKMTGIAFIFLALMWKIACNSTKHLKTFLPIIKDWSKVLDQQPGTDDGGDGARSGWRMSEFQWAFERAGRSLVCLHSGAQSISACLLTLYQG